MTTTGEYLTQLLASYGVDTVFGIPGVHTIELYRGLTGSGIRHVTPRHEQGAGFMADGYARACGRPGVCFIISGPGMTNTILLDDDIMHDATDCRLAYEAGLEKQVTDGTDCMPE